MDNLLLKKKPVPFKDIYLDPNNPRTAPEHRPGYEDPEELFGDEQQARITEAMEPFAKDVEKRIASQGWVPIDPILVWEHPKRKGKYTVIEGNTRTVALRNLRGLLTKTKEKLERMEKRSNSYAAEELTEQRQDVARLNSIIESTDELEVFPIVASSASELEDKLPLLHGVRHINHAIDWTPYALNLYILSRYRQLFSNKYPDGRQLALEDALIQELAESVSLNETKTRQNIQAASAFSRFKRNFEDQLPDGDSFIDRDQYFFEQILQSPHPRNEFGFEKTDLHLSPEMEEVLFKWAFAKPRKGGGEDEDGNLENPNKLRIAEDIRLWNKLKKYDNKHKTNFAAQFDVASPDSAPQMSKLETDYLNHKEQVSPLDTIGSLLDALKELKVETLRSQGTHLRPMLKQMIKEGESYLKMLEAAK